MTGRTFGKSRYGRAAFGAQFAKVAVDEERAACAYCGWWGPLPEAASLVRSWHEAS